MSKTLLVGLYWRALLRSLGENPYIGLSPLPTVTSWTSSTDSSESESYLRKASSLAFLALVSDALTSVSSVSLALAVDLRGIESSLFIRFFFNHDGLGQLDAMFLTVTGRPF